MINQTKNISWKVSSNLYFFLIVYVYCNHNYNSYYSKPKEENSEQLQLFSIEPEVTEGETNIEPEVTEGETNIEPEVTEEENQNEQLVRVIPNLLNVRFAAEKDSTIVTIVSKDDELILLDKEPINGFYHIITKTGIEGYCMVEFVELVQEVLCDERKSRDYRREIY